MSDARGALPEITRKRLDKMCREIVRDSIVEDAIVRLMAQGVAEIMDARPPCDCQNQKQNREEQSDGV